MSEGGGGYAVRRCNFIDGKGTLLLFIVLVFQANTATTIVHVILIRSLLLFT